MVAQGGTKRSSMEGCRLACPSDPLSPFIKTNPLGWEAKA